MLSQRNKKECAYLNSSGCSAILIRHSSEHYANRSGGGEKIDSRSPGAHPFEAAPLLCAVPICSCKLVEPLGFSSAVSTGQKKADNTVPAFLYGGGGGIDSRRPGAHPF